MSAHRLPKDLYEAANAGVLRLADPGNGGTIDLRSVSGGVVELTIAAVGETRVLPDTTLLKPGITVTLVANQITSSGTCIVGGVTLGTEGDAASFVTSTVNGAMAWTPASQPSDAASGTLDSSTVLSSDDAYNATTWNGSLQIPSKNAVRDKIEALVISAGATPPYINVLDYGAVGDGSTDDTAAFEAAIAACPRGGVVFVPAITTLNHYYKITSTLTLTDGVSLLGEGHREAHCSRILGSGSAFTLISFNRNKSFIAHCLLASTGHCIDASSSSDTHIHDVSLACGDNYWCIYSDGNTFNNHYTNLTCLYQNSNRLANGVMCGALTYLDGLNCSAFNIGLRVWGGGNRIKNTYLEVDNIAVQIGRDHNGDLFSASNLSYEGGSFESNKLSMWVRASDASFRNLWSNGTSGSSPWGTTDDQEGAYYLSAVSNCSFEQVGCANYSPGYSNMTWIDVYNSSFTGCQITNGSASGTAWSPGVNLLNHSTGNTMLRCNWGRNPSDTLVAALDSSAVRTNCLIGADAHNASAQGRNLRVIDYPIGNGATEVTITYPHSFAAGMTSATAANTGGATLAAGTYYYVCTALLPNGEYFTGANEVSVTISGANNSANLVTFGSTSTYKKRIYRGTATGVYDGYFELATNTDSLADIGQAFTVTGCQPPAAGSNDITSREPDTNYALVGIVPSYSTTAYQVPADRGTNTIKVKFGTAAGASDTFSAIWCR